MIIAIPFGWVNAFYHNISIVATGPKSTVRSSLAEALESVPPLAEAESSCPRHPLLRLAFSFPQYRRFLLRSCRMLLNMFFGVMTVFDENGSAWQNTSFYLDVFVLCYLVLNPLSKAIYALRYFYGRARLTGADFKAELRRQEKLRQEQAPGRVLVAALFLSVVFSFHPGPGGHGVATAARSSLPASTALLRPHRPISTRPSRRRCRRTSSPGACRARKSKKPRTRASSCDTLKGFYPRRWRIGSSTS